MSGTKISYAMWVVNGYAAWIFAAYAWDWCKRLVLRKQQPSEDDDCGRVPPLPRTKKTSKTPQTGDSG